MNARHKKFILNKLIPFILREQGRGFGMDDWRQRLNPGEVAHADNLDRRVPVCGTVCCIGGSIEFLKKYKHEISTQKAGKDIGLTYPQAVGLFMEWGEYSGYASKDGNEYGWPNKFAIKFREASTPYHKARVAVSLLKEVVKTSGECLRLD